MKTAIIICLTLISFGTALAGWERTYGGSDEEYGFSVVQTSDSGYVIVGYTGSFGAGLYDVYLVKTDSAGDTLWTRTYGGINVDVGRAVVQTTDGGYIIVGETFSYSAGSPDIYLVKTNVNGDTIWTRTYGGSNNDEGWSVAQTFDGGYIVTGRSHSFGAGESDVYLVKTDALGDTLWTRTYGGSEYDEGYSVAQTSDGGYIVAGGTESFGAGRYDVYLVKTDAVGDTIWTRTYGGSDFDRGHSVAQTSDGGNLVVGQTTSYGIGGADVYLVKTDTDGDTIWTRNYGGSNYDSGCSVIQTFDGGYLIGGISASFGAGERDAYILKTTPLGDTIWTHTYGGSQWDGIYSVAQTIDGGYIFAGATESFGAGEYDMYLIKTDSLGYTGIEEKPPSPKPEAFKISAYPNPFNSAVIITVSGKATSPLQIEVFDINGRRINVIARSASDEAISPNNRSSVPLDARRDAVSINNHEFVWQPDESLPSGVYLVRATIEDETTSKRIVYLK